MTYLDSFLFIFFIVYIIIGIIVWIPGWINSQKLKSYVRKNTLKPINIFIRILIGVFVIQ